MQRWLAIAVLMVASGAVAHTQTLLPVAGSQTAREQLTLPKPGETLPSFEVATVKPAADSPGMMTRFMPDGFMTQNVELRMVIREAFGATSDAQIVGGAESLLDRPFDINAKADADLAAALKKMPREDRNRQMRLMLQALLVERFHLKTHIETKEMPVYALVVAKGGPKLKESVPPPPPPAAGDAGSGGQPAMPAPPAPDKPLPKQLPPGSMMMRMSSNHVEATASAGTIDGIAKFLVNQPDTGGKQIVDRTGLTGKYDWSLDWTPLGMGMVTKGADNGTAANADADAPGLFTALEEQLGLKLVPDRGPVEVVVIDHIEAPSAN